MTTPRSLVLRRAAWSVAKFALGAYVAVGLAAYLGSERLIFVPQPLVPPPGERGGVVLESDDGSRIDARYLPVPGARHTVLYSHGNADALATDGPVLERFRAAGFSVMAYDYPGYGRSGGRASERGAYRAADAAYEFLVRERRIDPGRIVAYGFSLGGAVSIDLASRRPVGALVVESTFTTAFRVLTQVPLFPVDRFRSISKLGTVRCPVLLVHGTGDEIIHVSHAHRLFAAAPEPKRLLVVEAARHGEAAEMAGPRLTEAMRWLVGEAPLPGGSGPSRGEPAPPPEGR